MLTDGCGQEPHHMKHGSFAEEINATSIATKSGDPYEYYE